MEPAFPPLLKFPRTPHLEGSGVQAGDALDRLPLSALPEDAVLVYEEKVDGANAGFRFDGAGNLMMQSRGRYLDPSDRHARGERDWVLLKDWLRLHQDAFLERFEDRYIVYGEFLGITHSVFYDRLPSLFLEFDIFDLKMEVFLDTPARRELCAALPIASVPVLHMGSRLSYREVVALTRLSTFRTPPDDIAEQYRDFLLSGETWRENLRRACALVGDDYARRLPRMDQSDNAEGLYVKAERDGQVIGRYKWVRPGFVQTILQADEHWQSRFLVPNLLARPVLGFPAYLSHRNPGPEVCYQPDHPWLWAPWVAPQQAQAVPMNGPR